ncbi:MAG: hypothetical protein ACYTGX_18180 [Planctomycetota bacterium]|jgi:hypothetical protein
MQCNGTVEPAKKPDTPTAEQPATPTKAVELAAVTMPENVIGAAAFIEAPEANEGRVAITGAVLQADPAKHRFLLCDQAEAGCIGGD